MNGQLTVAANLKNPGRVLLCRETRGHGLACALIQRLRDNGRGNRCSQGDRRTRAASVALAFEDVQPPDLTGFACEMFDAASTIRSPAPAGNRRRTRDTTPA